MRTWISILGVGLLAACGAEPTPARDVGGVGAACSAGFGPGDYTFTLAHDGVERTYDVHVPPAAAQGEPLPVVFYFHPLLTDRDYLQQVGTVEKADAEGFIAVYADGIHNSWNAGSCCGPSNGAGGQPLVDDLGFVRRMAAAVDHDLCTDRSRYYATGFSNGGFLSHRLACEASDIFAAVAPVSSVNGLDPAACNPGRAVPVMAINGTDDKLVPYAGGVPDESDPVLAQIVDKVVVGRFASVEQSFSDWAQRDGCTDAPVVTYQSGTATCVTHDECAGGVEVTQCTVTGAGHCWFGEPMCQLGINSADVVATDATWDFLRRFSHPEGGASFPAGVGGMLVPVGGLVADEPVGTTGGVAGMGLPPTTGGLDVGGAAAGTGGPVVTEPPTGIDLNGAWALRQLATQNVMAPLVGNQVSEVTTLAVVHVVHDGTTVTSTQTICDMLFSPVAGTTTTWPAAAIGALPAAVSMRDLGVVDIGSSYVQSTVGPLGWDSASVATDTLPPDAMDARVVDADGDGKPGVTIQLMGLIGGEVYVVARTSTEITGTVVSPDRIEGSHVTHSAQNVIGASNPLLMSNVPSTPDPDPAKNPVTLVRMSTPESGCAELMGNLATLFP